MTGNFQNIRTVHRLTGRNYLQWSPLVRTVLRCKGKPSHLTGISLKPEDPQFIVCEEEDSMIMSWLLNSMLLEIGKPFLYLSSTNEIWDAISETYSMLCEFMS